MVVIAILGTLFFVVYQLLTGIWTEDMSGGSSLKLEGLFKRGREKAFSEGKHLILELNLEKKKMGLREKSETEHKMGQIFAEENPELIEEEIPEEDLSEEEREEKKAKWVVEPVNMPDDIVDIYSVSGLKLEAPVLFIHFYPNGTTDSVIFHLSSTEKPYLFIPRYNTSPVYLGSLDFHEEKIE